MKPIKPDDITDDAFQRIKEMLGDQEELLDTAQYGYQMPNISLTTQQRFDIYNDVLALLDSEEDHKQIAQKVVAYLNQHINDKLNAARKRREGKSPIFRRVDE